MNPAGPLAAQVRAVGVKKQPNPFCCRLICCGDPSFAAWTSADSLPSSARAERSLRYLVDRYPRLSLDNLLMYDADWLPVRRPTVPGQGIQ
jgi:hypothetical protein